MRLSLLLFGWPPVATAFVAFGFALFTGRWWPAFAGAVVAAPFCLFVTRYPLFYFAGHLAIVANFASAYLIYRERRDVAFAALLPLMLISAVLVVFSIRQITLLPVRHTGWGPFRVSTYNSRMPYPEYFVAPMRQEMVDLGARELRTGEDVDVAVSTTAGTLMIVVNSVCGCAAGKARPGVALALRHPVRPDVVTTVFAGFDVDATDRARSYFTGYQPSSPSIALLQNGALVYMLERRQIENRDAHDVAAQLTAAFDKFCPATAKAGV